MSIKSISEYGLEYLKTVYHIDRVACDIVSTENAVPSQDILVIVKKHGQNWLDKFHWGFVPFWAKNISAGRHMINARVETIAEKPSFRHAFKKQRCLILAQGYYEWKKVNNSKQPILITLPDDKPFAFAGLWDIWKKTHKDKSIYKSCVIVTTEASASIREIHHRMPAILKPEVYQSWLDPENHDIAALKQLLKSEIITQCLSTPATPGQQTQNNQLSLFD